MAAADTARLIASLELKDKFSGQMGRVLGTLDQAEGRFGRIGQLAQQGVATFTKNVALLGVAAAGGIAVAVKSGLRDLAELESAIASVDGAITTLGLTGQLTGSQVADWANDIERDIGAAFDDKAITAAAAGLLRYGKVAPKNLRPALVVMTDLAAKTGDVEGASELLAKALADPAKAAGRLTRIGIILTDQQKEQIKALTDAGDAAGAQAKLLDILSKSTEGAARASQGPYARSLAILNDVSEDARKALAEGFLPVIEKVADRLGKAVGDPKFIAGIREFGQTLAAGLDDLIDIASNLPWATIGESLKIAGAGAKTLLGAFTSLPPWVQTAVITGWGLNKLTGGALGGIVGELGKGLIKGVLGINAGVVNITAGSVSGAGGVPAAGAAGKGGIGTLGKVFLAAEAVGLVAAVISVQQAVSTGNEKVATGIQTAAREQVANAPTRSDLVTSIAAVEKGIIDLTNVPFYRTVSGQTLETLVATRNELKTALAALDAQVASDGTSERSAIARAAAEGAAATAKVQHAAQQTAAAIRDKDLSVEVNVAAPKVSVQTFISGQNTAKTIYRTQS